MEKPKEECSEHPGEQRRLVCVEPCKALICQKCVGNHRKHDLRAADDVANEIIQRLETVRKQEDEECTTATNNMELIGKLRADIEKYRNERVEEEKALEQVLVEPLKEILGGFQEKVSVFLKMLATKEASCVATQQDTTEKLTKLYSEIDGLTDALKGGDACAIYQKWLQSHAAPPVVAPTEAKAKPEPKPAEVDMDTLRSYERDLKDLNISERMRIIVRAETNTLQIQTADPFNHMWELMGRTKEEMKTVGETMVLCQKSLRTVSKDTETAIKDVERNVKAMSNKVAVILKAKEKDKEKKSPIKGEELETLSKTLETTEGQLKKSRDRLIIESKTGNSQFMSLTDKQKEVKTGYATINKYIVDWERNLEVLNKESEDLDFSIAKTKESLDSFSKFMKKFDIQYWLKLQEFEKLDEKLQYIRNCVTQNKAPEPEQEANSKKLYKLRVSVISASNDRATSLPLINLFLSGSPEAKAGGGDVLDEKSKAAPGEYGGVKGYSLSAKLSDKKGAEFDIWYIGSKKDIKVADPSFYKNVEVVLLVYDRDESEADCLEHIKHCVDELAGKMAENAIIVLTGVSKKAMGEGEGETGSSDEGAIAHYATERGMPLKYTKLTSAEDVKELFYRMLYSKYPESYEEALA